MSHKNTVSTGKAGKYFVAGELERRGFTVAAPMSNKNDFDMLAINRETHVELAIKVKTTGYKQKRWTLSSKSDDLKGDNIFYIFVALNQLEEPEYHIVPSNIVANTLTHEYQAWLKEPGKNGRTHNPNNMRNFTDNEDTYRNRWDLLQTSSTSESASPVYNISKKWIAKFRDPDIMEDEILDHFMSDDLKALGFVMDCGKGFEKQYGRASYDDEELEKNINSITDVDLLGSAVYSRWRYYNHWAMPGEGVLDAESRKWFILALNRLMVLSK